MSQAQPTETQPFTPLLVLGIVANCINQTFEGDMEPERCIALCTAANAYASLYVLRRDEQVEQLIKEVELLKQQIVLQQTQVNA